MIFSRLFMGLTLLTASFFLFGCKSGDESNLTHHRSNDSRISAGAPSNTARDQSELEFEPIQIHSAPQDTYGYPGQTAGFNVAASSIATLAYQWFFNGEPINGATLPTFEFTINNSSDAGAYQVEVSNHSTSELTTAHLTVGHLPFITQQPQSTSVYPGETTHLTVQSQGTDLQYEWQQKTQQGWVGLPGADRNVLQIIDIDLSHATPYRVRISNPGGETLSSPAKISIVNRVLIVDHPANVIKSRGEDALFTVKALGNNKLKYQWFRDKSPIKDGNRYSGTNTHTLSVSNITSELANLYRVQITDLDKGKEFSDYAELSVRGPANITVNPKDTMLFSGQPGSLRVAASGDKPMHYQWQKWNGRDWKNVAKGKRSDLHFQAAGPKVAGRYRCIVNNASSKDISAAANIQVNQGAEIVSAPKSQSANVGDAVSFTIKSRGDNLQYEWTKNGEIIPETSANLSFAAIKPLDEATYSCRIFNQGNSVNCPDFSLSIQAGAIITQQPTSQTTYEGGSATLSVATDGDPSPSVEWYFKNTLIGRGNQLPINNVEKSQEGEYRCLVKNHINQVKCDPIKLTVQQSTHITSQPGDIVVHEGEALDLYMTAKGNDLDYEWTKNGNRLYVNSSVLSFASTHAVDKGVYSCRAWNNHSSDRCNDFSVSLYELPTIKLQPQDTSGYEGQRISLSTKVSGNPSPSVDWYRNDILIANNSPVLTLDKLNANQAGEYDCVVSNSAHTIKCQSAYVTVKQKARITQQPSSQVVSIGDTIAFNVSATGEPPLKYACYQNNKLKITSSTPSGLTIRNASKSDQGNYYCTVSNAGTQAKSRTSAITVVEDETRNIMLGWTAPTQRSNGKPLRSQDIASYHIHLSSKKTGPFETVKVSEGSEPKAIVRGLLPGTYFISIRTEDKGGLESSMSTPIKISVK